MKPNKGGVFSPMSRPLATGLLWLCIHLQAMQPIQAAGYDFEALAPGSLSGRDGWLSEPGLGEMRVVVDPTTVNGSRVIQPIVGLASGWYGYLSRVNDAAFAFDAVSGNTLVLQFDANGEATAGFALGRDLNGDGLLSRSSGEIGPVFGTYKDTGGGGSNRFLVHGGGLRTSADDFTPAHSVALSTPQRCCNDPEDWYRLQLRIDLAAAGGAGSAGLHYRNLSRGDAAYLPVSELQGLNMHLDGMAAGAEPQRWDTMWILTQFEGERHIPRLDNLVVQSGSSSPIIFKDAPALAGDAWRFVSAVSGYPDAVVILGPPSSRDPQPGVARIRNAGAQGFELRFQEWDYLGRDFGDTSHAIEAVPYLVLKPGRHTLGDGSVWETGVFTLGGTNDWKQAWFSEPFSRPPRLFLSVQTNNGGQAVSVRARQVTTDGFEAALFEEEALMDGHITETVAYLAIHSPAGNGQVAMDGRQIPYLLQTLQADQRWVPVLSQRLMLQEESSLDTELAHADETLNVAMIGTQLFAQQVSDNDADTTALRRLEPAADAAMEWGLIRDIDQDWRVLPFARNYSNPVIVAKPVSGFGGDPGVIRLHDVSGRHALLRYQEWEYLDGIHPATEDVFYLVAEAGLHGIGGLNIEAGRLASYKLGRAGQWENIAFSSTFIHKPVLLSSVMSSQGTDAVITRIKDLRPSGFLLSMDEQEAKADGHGNETLGWVAIQQGTGLTGRGQRLQAFFDQADHDLMPIPYPLPTAYRYPVVLGDVDSCYGRDPVVLRYADPGATQIQLRLAEEQSLDLETTHVPEDVGLFVAE